MTSRVLSNRTKRAAVVLALVAGTGSSLLAMPGSAIAAGNKTAEVSTATQSFSGKWSIAKHTGQVRVEKKSKAGTEAHLWRNSTATTTVTGSGTLILHASGDQYGGQAPEVEVKVDGKVIGRNKVVNAASQGYWEYPTGSALGAGKHKVEVRYFNDYADKNGDRNVRLGWVSLNSDTAVVAPVTAPSTTKPSAPVAKPVPSTSSTSTAPSTPAPVVTKPASTPTATTTATATAKPVAPITSTPVTAPVTSSGNPFVTKAPFADPAYQSAAAANARRGYDPAGAAALDRITQGGVALWLGDWDGMGVDAKARTYAQKALAAGKTPVVVTYAIPGRDCGLYSAGGLNTSNYNSWTQKVADGLKGTGAVVIVEPDAVAQAGQCGGQGDRLGMIKKSVQQFKAAGLTSYIDAGNSGWTGSQVSTIAARLKQAGIEDARGFATNVSNFNTSSQEKSYADNLSNQLGGKNYVIDTSRNGVGGNGQWCNPQGRKLGTKPGVTLDGSKQDASLWIKMVGESDGDCGRGEPAAGTFWVDYAIGLAR